MTAELIGKALAVWAAMAVVAVANGILRQNLLVGALGEPVARPLSAAMMLALVFALTWAFLAWAGRPAGSVLWLVGGLWLVLTVIFESALGLFMRGMSAAEIAATYNPLAPTLWFFVILGILVAPPAVAWLTRG